MKKAIQLFFVLFVVLCSFCFTSCENPLFIDVSKLYTVKFETNGGTPIESYRTSRIESIPTIEKTDATFVGWYISASFSGNPITLPLDITQDTTLYAKWNQRYTVLFETNGGTEIESYKTDVIRETPQTTKRDCNFIGWYTSGTFAGEKVTFPYTLTDSVTLYAKWEPLYNASFATNGGVAISTYKVGTIASIPQTTRVGYRLVSWYLDSNFTNPVSFPYQLDSDTIFYAKWVESNDTVYHVEHYKQDENMSMYTLVETESLTGTTGYETEAVAKVYTGFHVNNFEQENIAAAGNTVIKIYYDRNRYTIAFNANGGNGSAYSQDFYYGIPQNLVTNTYTLNGCSFTGWSTSENGDVVYTNKQKVENLTTENEETITLYAQWYSGVIITASDVQNLNLTSVPDNYIIKVTGNLTNSTLETLATKIKTASNNITLDLSEADIVAIGATADNKSIFAECDKLETIILPETLTTIGSYAFVSTSIVSVSIPSSVRTIGDHAFALCKNLESIELDGVETIGQFAFFLCEDLESVIIKNVTTIGSSVFYGCDSLEMIYLENISTIGSFSFSECDKLYSIRIDALTVGAAAFRNCSSLTAVTIGRRVSKLDNDYSTNSNTNYRVFEGCSNLTSVTFEDTNNWHYKFSSTYSPSIDVTNAATNATNLKDYYAQYVWYKE